MKKCNDCNVEMLENIRIEGQHPFELGSSGSSDIEIIIHGKNIFAKTLSVKCRVCPNCGKVELYVDKEKLQ